MLSLLNEGGFLRARVLLICGMQLVESEGVVLRSS